MVARADLWVYNAKNFCVSFFNQVASIFHFGEGKIKKCFLGLIAENLGDMSESWKDQNWDAVKEATVGSNSSSSVQFEVRPANYKIMARIAKGALSKCPRGSSWMSVLSPECEIWSKLHKTYRSKLWDVVKILKWLSVWISLSVTRVCNRLELLGQHSDQFKWRYKW